jgi:LPS sulfotransferase NodH
MLQNYDFSTPPGQKPDTVDLIGPWFDRPRGEPAAKTLLICAAPRTGSNNLARLLLAAGIGVPHEYFNPTFAAVAAARWGFPPAVLSAARIANYIGELRRRRSAGGVFATKLQYSQYRDYLCNDHGRALFDGAVVVHLFRADVFRQFLSYIEALETGRYDFSDRPTRSPHHAVQVLDERSLLGIVEALTAEDSGFRKLFLLLGIRPLFVEFDELNREPRAVLGRIGQALGVTVNEKELEKAVAVAGPYRKRESDSKKLEPLLETMRSVAFRK